MTPLEVEALWLSLRVSLTSVAVSLVPGVALAWLLARRSFRGKVLVEGLVYLPLVLPPVAVGLLLLILFGRSGPVGRVLHGLFGIDIAFTWKAAALASAVMAFPLLVRAIRLSFEAVDARLPAAARTLGASRARVFVTVTLPLIAPGLIAGSILAFARGLSEFGATMTFAANIPGETRTLPLAIHALAMTPGGESGALRLCVLSLVVALVALAASEVLARRATARVLGRA